MHFKNLLKCINCDKNIILTKENSLRMFMTDNLICNHCHTLSEFPFYWLLAQMESSITKNKSTEDSVWKDTILSRMFKANKLETL